MLGTMTGQRSSGSLLFDVTAIGAGLPFAAVAGDLDEALAGGVAVVQAPPGTGKTTVVPPVVANHVAAAGEAGPIPSLLPPG